jgi:hypothetical protein
MSTFSSSHNLICTFRALDDIQSTRDHNKSTGSCRLPRVGLFSDSPSKCHVIIPRLTWDFTPHTSHLNSTRVPRHRDGSRHRKLSHHLVSYPVTNLTRTFIFFDCSTVDVSMPSRPLSILVHFFDGVGGWRVSEMQPLSQPFSHIYCG